MDESLPPDENSLLKLGADLDAINQPDSQAWERWQIEKRQDVLFPFLEKARLNCAIPLEVVLDTSKKVQVAVIAGLVEDPSGPRDISIYYLENNFWLAEKPHPSMPAILTRAVSASESVAEAVFDNVKNGYDISELAPVNTYRNMYPTRLTIHAGKDKPMTRLVVSLTGTAARNELMVQHKGNLGFQLGYGVDFEDLIKKTVITYRNLASLAPSSQATHLDDFKIYASLGSSRRWYSVKPTETPPYYRLSVAK